MTLSRRSFQRSVLEEFVPLLNPPNEAATAATFIGG